MLSSHKYYLNLLVCTLLLFITGCGNAQVASEIEVVNLLDDSAMVVTVDTSYNFIDYNANHLVFFDSTQLRRFAEKWYYVLATGKGNVNIMQLGSSHVQGGTFPHRLRYNMISPVKNLAAARGMIFPYSAAVKCNNPYDYKVSRSREFVLTRNVYKEPDQLLGLCGIAVTAADSLADICITLSEPDIDFATDRIVLLGHSVGGVTPLVMLHDSQGGADTVEPSKIDIDHRRYYFQLPEAVDSFHIVLPCTEGQSFAITGVYLDNGRPGISYHSIGVNGSTLSDYLDRCPHFTQDLELVNPDLVIFCIGINDATGTNFDTVLFKNRYLRLVDSIRSVNPECAFVFATNNDSFRRVKRKYSVNENGLLAREAFYRIAQCSGGAVWDQFAVMGGLGSMETWKKNELAQRDMIHFTRKGYQLLGDLLSNAILEAVAKFKPLRPELYQNKKSKKARKDNDLKSEDERYNYISY